MTLLELDANVRDSARSTYRWQTSYARFDHMTSPTVRRATPRPHFDEPRLIRRADAPHHVWGDEEGGFVTDRVISSSDQLHVLEFELPPGGRFGHTASNPTLFAADVAYLCVGGTLCLADPESGQVVLVPEGSGVYFGRDTWHHGFAVGPRTARVVEFMSPPPVLGTASTYGRTRPLLAETRYRDRRWEGRWPQALTEQRTGGRLVPLGAADGLLSFRDATPGHLVWTLVDTPLLTVVRGEVQPGTVDEFTRQDKETVLRVVEGELWVDVRDPDAAETAYTVGCLQAGDACFVPAGHEVRTLVRADRPAVYLQGFARVPDGWHP
jgi:hypothetical protein